MLRRIIKIDGEKCNGCGACAAACHEGAIAMVNGKAALLRDDFCDGFGDCLPECPAGALTFEEREAPAYDEAAVQAAQNRPAAHGSGLRNWPCQIKLAPVCAPYFKGARLLIAADCTAYAFAAFHTEYARGRVVLIGCPKLDGVDYTAKLQDILQYNDINNITLLRMEVPCCGGLERAARCALQASGKKLPFRVVTVGIDGRILPE